MNQPLLERAERGAERGADVVWSAALDQVATRGAPTPRHRRRQAVAAVAVLVAGVGTWFIVDRLDRSTGTVETSAAPGSESPAAVREIPIDIDLVLSSLPVGYPLDNAPAVFVADGPPEVVGDLYLRSRFPDADSIGVHVSGRASLGEIEALRWRWPRGDESAAIEQGAPTGWLFLRSIDRGYEVVAATTDGLSTADVVVSAGRAKGEVRSDNVHSLFADVLHLNGDLVPGSPRPEGWDPDAPIRLGTASGPGTGSLVVDVPVDDSPVVLRVSLVGGTVLGVTEHVVPVHVESTECTGRVVVVNAGFVPGVATDAVAQLRRSLDSGAVEGVGEDAVADPEQSPGGLDSALLASPAACANLRDHVATELGLSEVVNPVWSAIYEGLIDDLDVDLGDGDLLVVLGFDAAEGDLVAPDLVGLLADSARLTAEALGLPIDIELEVVGPGSEAIGRVMYQSPPGGVPIVAGSTITLSVGDLGQTADVVNGGLVSLGVIGTLTRPQIDVQLCDAGFGPGSGPPVRKDEFNEPYRDSTPRLAMDRFVERWVADGWDWQIPTNDWYEATLTDGRVAFAWSGGDSGPAESFNIVLWLDSDEDGWFVYLRETSGC